MLYRATLILILLASAAAAQPAPGPTLTRVTITSPPGTPQAPFRTNLNLLSIDFTTDAANGVFFATSQGADVPMSTFLANTSNGRVGAGLLTEGIKSITVLVSSSASSPTTKPIIVVSAPVTVIYDISPPQVVITQIRLRPAAPFEGYDPTRIYRTNANAITLKGFVNDGANGVSPDQITVSITGTSTPVSANADRTGSWELTADISREPEGPIDLRVVATDNVGPAREGNISDGVPVGLR